MKNTVFRERTLYSNVTISLLGKGKLLRSYIFVVVSFTLPPACSFNDRFRSIILRQLSCAPNSEGMSVVKIFGVT